MSIQLAIVMDPIGSIKIHKDSSFAMLLAAQARGWALLYMEQQDLFLRDGEAFAMTRSVEVRDQAGDWFKLGEPEELRLGELDVILMRKDPPLDMEFIYTTHLLEQAERAGALVVNRPSALRNCNEKLFAAQFPDCCAPNLVSRDPARLRGFLDKYGDIILKPLDGMGGASIFRIQADDPNISVILETLTALGQRTAMAQQFIP